MSTDAPTWTLSPHEYHATVDKIAAINRRAQRRGFTGRLELHATQATEKVNAYPGDARERVVFVTRLLGSPPAYAGWELLAAIDTLPTTAGGHEVVLRCAPGVSDVDVDRSLLQPGRCEHCNTVRTNRRHTYLVRRTSDSQLRQVGSTCLKDFLGWAGTPVFLSVDDTQDDLERGLGGGIDEFTPATVLAYAYAAVEVYGWAPASFEHPTKNIVAEALYGHGRLADEIRDELAPHLAAGENAAPAIATALLEGLTENYGYEANLTSALRAASVGPRELGLLCSAIPAYQRVTGAKATAAQHAEAPNAWLGRVDAPLTATGVIATALTVDGYAYGTTQRLLVITTPEGTVKVVTAAGWAYDVIQGDEVTVAGTVKAHEVYREHKQTRLVRPRLVPSPALAKGGGA